MWLCIVYLIIIHHSKHFLCDGLWLNINKCQHTLVMCEVKTESIQLIFIYIVPVGIKLSGCFTKTQGLTPNKLWQKHPPFNREKP